VWAVGDWPAKYLRVVPAHGGVLVVAGPCAATDRDLAALAERVPDDAASAWPGAYTIVRASTGCMQVWTDPACAAPVYTTRTRDGALVWATSARALADLTAAAVDEGWLAAHLIRPTAYTPGRSAFTGIRLLPAGYRWTATRTGEPQLTAVWSPPPYTDRDGAVRQLRAELAAAVHLRVATARRAGSDLSGGLDSSTVTALAAHHGPVTAVTVHPAGVHTGGDLDHARAVAASYPHLRHLLLPLSQAELPFTGLDEPGRLPATDEPAPSTLAWARLSAQFRRLAAEGVDEHLTGDGGDTLCLAPPAYLADLARTGRWVRLVADAQRWARLRRISPWPMLVAAARRDATVLAGTGRRPGWATGTALRAAGPLLGTPARGADQALLDEARWVARTCVAESQLAAAHGIGLHNPYVDPRIVATVLPVPPPQRTSPTRYKPLLADAAINVLPERVRRRAAKGLFAVDYHHGVRAHHAALHRLADGHLADAGLIDPVWMRRQIDAAAAGLDVTWSQLQPPLAAEAWLRALAAATPVRWTVQRTTSGKTTP
jgi:asparagine synthase (glutamine-hydrolysing)